MRCGRAASALVNDFTTWAGVKLRGGEAPKPVSDAVVNSYAAAELQSEAETGRKGEASPCCKRCDAQSSYRTARASGNMLSSLLPAHLRRRIPYPACKTPSQSKHAKRLSWLINIAHAGGKSARHGVAHSDTDMTSPHSMSGSG